MKMFLISCVGLGIVKHVVMSTNQPCVYITDNLRNAGRSCKIDIMNITISHGCLQIFPLTYAGESAADTQSE